MNVFTFWMHARPAKAKIKLKTILTEGLRSQSSLKI